MIPLLLALLQTGEPPYTVDYLTPPEGDALEVGGMDFLPDGRLVVSTRRGQVWLVEEPLASDPADARFDLFVEGLWEGLGLTVEPDGDSGPKIFVLQRGELSLLRPNESGFIATVSDDWGLSGNYHEFVYGLPRDAEGNFYISLNVAFLSPKWWHGKSPVPWRGWVLRVAPTGETTPVACGFRSPCGIGMNAAGDLFVTDNQGDWMPASPIFHVKEGGFYGHPASLDWTPEYLESQAKASDTIPPERANDREPAAVWLPYKWSRSPGNLVPDVTGGKFGPFEEQLFLAELTNGMILRVQLEKVRGEYQGAVFPFLRDVGSACRVAFAPDGTLFVGMTNRGWGGRPPASGIARVRWNGTTPMEMRTVRLLQDGFEIDLTLPVAADCAITPDSVALTQYDYDYWWEYGSPERNTTAIEVTSTELSDDRRRLTVRTAGLTPAMMARLVLSGVVGVGGAPLHNDEFAYTINQLPEGEPTDQHVAKIVPPPPARESGAEGWLRLTYGDATDGWNHSGWELCDAELDPDDPTKLRTQKGVNALTNTLSDEPSDYVSKHVFGDASIHVEFLLPQGGKSGVRVMGRYAIELADREPMAAGVWHDLDVDFRAPRFDAEGNKTENAKFLRVKVDDVLVHEELELPEPSPGALGPEVALGPLVLVGTSGPVGFGNVRVRPAREADETKGWKRIFNGEDLDGWTISDDGLWYVEDETIVGEGPRSHLFSPRDDYRNVDIRAKVKIGDGGNSGLYFRTAYGPGWPAGYEAQINSSYADPQKTGSLYGLAPVKTHLIPPDTWFDYRVTCRDVEAGTHVVIRVNGVVITDYVDAERKYESGHIALQQHHDGSVIEVRDFEVRDLDAR